MKIHFVLLPPINGEVNIVDTPDDFIEAVKNSLENDNAEKKNLRLACARENT